MGHFSFKGDIIFVYGNLEQEGDMMAKKQTLIFGLFLAFCFIVSIFSFFISVEVSEFQVAQNREGNAQSSQESFFKKAHFFTLKNGQPYLDLNASELSNNSRTGETTFLSPYGAIIDKDSSFHYEGERGQFFKKSDLLFIQGNAKVRSGVSKASADKMTYYIAKNRLISQGNVKSFTINAKNGDKIFVDSDKAVSYFLKNRFRYVGNVVGKIDRKRAYEEGIDFKSNSIDLEMNKDLATLLGNVWVKKQQVTATSRRGEIFLENYNKKLKYFALYDDVKVRENVLLERAGKKSSFERKAFAEKLEGIMSENRIVLTGYPKVLQHQDIIKGNRIILRENIEVVEVEDANTTMELE